MYYWVTTTLTVAGFAYVVVFGCAGLLFYAWRGLGWLCRRARR